jgi:hypothetical protein
MSYSFEFSVATKEIAKTRVAAELDTVVAAQPVHVKDRSAALAAAHAFIDLLVDDGTKDIRVSMHGSVGYSWAPDVDAAAVPLTNASIGISAWHIPKAE